VDDVAAALHLLCCQLVPGTLVDQQFDERQPLRFVDRFGEQFSVTRIIESRILLIHSRAPRTCIPQTDCFGTPAAAQCDSGLPSALSTDQWLTTGQASCRRSRRTRRCVIARGEAIPSIDAVRHPGTTPISAPAWRGPTAPSKVQPAAIPAGATSVRKDGAR
jgi:hypothetical protein